VPFAGDSPFSIGIKHKSEMPREPKEINAQLPDDLSNVILRCLEKDRKTRYHSAAELRSELTNIEKGIPTTEKVAPKRKPLTSKEITVTFGLKRLLIPALVIIALVILAVVIVWRPWSQKKTIPSAPSGTPSLAIVYFENNTGNESLDHWRKALSELLIADLSQSKYLTILPGDRLYKILADLDQLEAKSYSSDVLKEVAAKAGVENILRGSYTKAGDTFRVNVMLQQASTGELLGAEGEEGKGRQGGGKNHHQLS
jgi:TolB-like protein